MSGFPQPVNIENVTGGVVQFGGAVFVSPKNAVKNSHGSGSSNIGAHILTVNGVSTNTTVDTDVIDQPIVQDN